MIELVRHAWSWLVISAVSWLIPQESRCAMWRDPDDAVVDSSPEDDERLAREIREDDEYWAVGFNTRRYEF